MRTVAVSECIQACRQMLTLVTGMLANAAAFINALIGAPIVAGLALVVAALGFLYSLGHSREI